LSVAVSLTEYVPGAAKVCDGEAPVDWLLPSPQSHMYVEIDPPGNGSVADPLKPVDTPGATPVGAVKDGEGVIGAKTLVPVGAPTPLGPSKPVAAVHWVSFASATPLALKTQLSVPLPRPFGLVLPFSVLVALAQVVELSPEHQSLPPTVRRPAPPRPTVL
jgi:hypothetical protein